MNVIHRFTVLFLLAVLLLPGLSSLEFEFGAVTFPGVLWMLVLPVALFLLALNFLVQDSPRNAFPCWPWLVWCSFVWVSLLWGDEVGRFGLREALKLSMPIVMGMLAASAVRTPQDLRWLFMALGVSLALLVLFAVAYVTTAFDGEWMNLLVRESALVATFIGCAFLAFFPRQKVLALSGWGAALLVATMTSSRMAALALLVVLLIHPYGWGRLFRKVAVAGVFAVVGFVIFNTPSFQAHFFKSGQGTVSDVVAGKIQGLGRFEVWPEVWGIAWERPWLGFGVGAIHSIVPELWKDMISIHNDYLRIFYELGWVGFGLTAVVCGWQLLDLRRRIAAREDDMVGTAFAAAWLGFWAMLVSCATDNTIAYVMYVNPLFILMGAAYGAARAESRASAGADLRMNLAAKATRSRVAPWGRPAIETTRPAGSR